MGLAARILPASLVGRLFAGSLLLFGISIPLLWSGFTAAIDQVAKEVVDTQLRTFGSQLRGYWASASASGVLAESENREGVITKSAPPSLFGESDVEWLWQISVEGRPVYRSTFLKIAGLTLQPATNVKGPDFTVHDINAEFGLIRVAERLVVEAPPLRSGLQSGNTVNPGAGIPVHYMVALPAERYNGYVNEYAGRLRRLTFLVTIPTSLFLLGIFAVMVASIRHSLNRVDGALSRFHQGKTDRIEGAFPTELQVLVDRVNDLFGQNRKLVERTRKYVTKIAHDLNHPLAVLKNGLQGPVDTETLNRQVDRMTGLVDRYASLARAIGPGGQVGGPLNIAEVLKDIRDGFSILYRRTPLAIDVKCVPELTFLLPRHDLETMVSNLLGNAHKHAKSRVVVSAAIENNSLAITIEDDGPGIPKERREAVFNWGKRLDEAPPGTGFGLSIVRDTADLYEGTVVLDESAMGGLKA